MVRHGGDPCGPRAPAEHSGRKRNETHPRLKSKTDFTEGLREEKVSRRAWKRGWGRAPGVFWVMSEGGRQQGARETLQTPSAPPRCVPKTSTFCVYGHTSIKKEGADMIPHLLKLAHSREPKAKPEK